jgi:hypothetical protein
MKTQNLQFILALMGILQGPIGYGTELYGQSFTEKAPQENYWGEHLDSEENLNNLTHEIQELTIKQQGESLKTNTSNGCETTQLVLGSIKQNTPLSQTQSTQPINQEKNLDSKKTINTEKQNVHQLKNLKEINRVIKINFILFQNLLGGWNNINIGWISNGLDFALNPRNREHNLHWATDAKTVIEDSKLAKNYQTTQTYLRKADPIIHTFFTSSPKTYKVFIGFMAKKIDDILKNHIDDSLIDIDNIEKSKNTMGNKDLEENIAYLKEGILGYSVKANNSVNENIFATIPQASDTTKFYIKIKILEEAIPGGIIGSLKFYKLENQLSGDQGKKAKEQLLDYMQIVLSCDYKRNQDQTVFQNKYILPVVACYPAVMDFCDRHR